MTSTLPPLVQAFSGAIGSAAANALVYPLDLVSTRLQTTSSKKLKGFRGILLAIRHVLRTEGWSGLYDGLPTDTGATLLSNFLYFWFYSFLRTWLVRRKARITPPRRSNSKGTSAAMLLSVTEELGIGFIAGLASRAISTPLSVITVRLQTETEGEDEDDELNTKKGSPHESREGLKRGSIIGTVQRLSEEEGLQGFWRGFTTTIPLSLNPAITLFLFQVFRKISSGYSVQKNQPLATPSAGSAFLGAAFSNAISTILLYPLILAKTRLQVHRKQGASSETMFSIWKRALLREGIPGAYQGLEAQIVKGFVSQGITMMVKQRMELLIVALYLRSLRRRLQ